MRLSTTDLELLRSRPTQTKLDLFVFRPRTVMKCRVNNTLASKNDRTIPYDTVSFGNISAVEVGMTLLVGTYEGGSDVGRARIKSFTSGVFIVGENSNVKWQDGLYLTVIRYWDLWTVFPRIIQNPSNEEDVIFYKDYDISYVNQNFNLGTFINAGTHRPIFLESNGTGTAYYSSTGTFNLLGNSLQYNWAFEGGFPSGSTQAVPGMVAYNTPGDYVTRLIVTDNANGNTDTTYRYVSVRNKIGEGSNTPIVRWEMNTLSGSRDEAGYTVEFKIYDTGIDLDENCLIMLRADDWYGNTHQSLGGNYPNNSEVFFVGYIERGSISYNAFHSYTSFTAVSVTGIMKRLTGFSVSVESKQNPATWFELRDMDCRRAIYHYLRWHSTVLSVTDFSFVGEDRKIQFFDVDRTSVFDAVDNLMKSALFGRLSSDRQGRLWADIDPLAYENPTGTFTPVMEITKRDWMSEPSVEEGIYDNSSYIEMGGIAYSGAITGTFAALLSGAPGYSPSYHGSVEKISGLAPSGQAYLNQLSGNLWANRNQKYPTISMDMSTPVRNLDIAPQEVVSIKINQSDTVRNEQIEGIYIPASISWTYKPDDRILMSQVEYIGVVSGDPGDTILIPETAEDGDFEFPEFSFPPFPPFALPGLPIIDILQTANLVIHVKNHGIFYTNNFNDEYPSWQSANVNLDEDKTEFRNFEVSSTGEIAVQVSYESIWTAPSPGAGWNLLFDANMIGNPENAVFGRHPAVSGFGMARTDGTILILASLNAGIFTTNLMYPWLGSSSGITRTATNIIPGQDTSSSQRFSYVTYNNGKWIVTLNTAGNAVASYTLPATGAGQGAIIDSENPIATSNNFSSIVHTASIESGDVVVSLVPNGKLSEDAGASYSALGGIGATAPFSGNGLFSDRFESIITNGDGTQIVVASNVPAVGIIWSLDGGSSWITGTSGGTNFGSNNATSVWHLGGSTYVYGASSNIYLIEDLALSTGSVNKTGNLVNLITGTFEVIAMRHY